MIFYWNTQKRRIHKHALQYECAEYQGCKLCERTTCSWAGHGQNDVVYFCLVLPAVLQEI
jgi:hypothetical protein